tara:strand:- start:4852 stop:5262 length:411 start_codon:yes stop_codon:yes gene_type:complete
MFLTIISSLIGPVSDLLSKFVVDKDKRAELAHEIATMATKQAHQQVLAQIEVNKNEAASKNLFVSGWRPFIGWVCGIGMCTNFLMVPFANFALAVSDSLYTVPMIDLSTMMPVLLGMLGLGGLRTVEKLKGVSRVK